MNYLQPAPLSRRRVKIPSFGAGMNPFSDKSILSAVVAKACYNFEFSTGALREGYGLEECLEIPRKVTNIWNFKRHDFDSASDEEILMYSGTDGKVYYQRNGVENYLAGIEFSSPPMAVNYRLYGDDVILICSKTDGMVVWDGSHDAYLVPNAPLITSMVIHYERMFCTVAGERNAVWFSSDLDPTNWDIELDRGGFIQVLDERGKLNRVISYLNHIYIFRDFGISRLTAFADQTDFAIGNLFVSSGKIYADTAVLCGDMVMFLASDGLYRFDGLSTHRVLPAISSMIQSSENATAVFHEGKYFVALKLDTDLESSDENSDKNNAVLAIDFKTGTYTILAGVSVKAFSSVKETLYALTEVGIAALMTRCGTLFGEPTEKSWASGLLDFESERTKTVREFFVETDEKFELTVYSERAKKQFTVTPVNGLAQVRVNVSGRKIGFIMKAKTAEARIVRPTLILSGGR